MLGSPSRRGVVVRLVDAIYGGVLGIVLGLAMHRVTVFQVKMRTEENAKVEAVNNTMVMVLWSALSGVLFALLFWRESETAVRLPYVMYMSIAIGIAVVDIDIRRIPNESVLAIMVVKTISIIVNISKGCDIKDEIFPVILGLVVGLVIYMIPSIFRVPIGAGDIKYCAAIGYCLGIYGFLEAALVMAVGLLAYLGYLKMTKKGSAKTATAMGPYLSLGVVATLLLPYESVLTLLGR